MYTDTSKQWTVQDAADCTRLANEMQEDARWQIQLFTFAVTATAIILGIISKVDSGTGNGIPAGLVFLSPLIVLAPTSLMILNRARTRNRKAGFMFAVLDCKRLMISGVELGDDLDVVKRRRDLPWETALHVIERLKPHLAPALLYMTVSSVFMELLCVGLTFWVERNAGRIVLMAVAVVAVVDVLLVSFRWRALFRLKHDKSIQGYAKAWLKSQDQLEIPKYLKDWVRLQPF